MRRTVILDEGLVEAIGALETLIEPCFREQNRQRLLGEALGRPHVRATLVEACQEIVLDDAIEQEG